MCSCNITCLGVSFDCIKNSFFCSTLLNFPYVMKISHPVMCKTKNPVFLLVVGLIMEFLCGFFAF